MTTPLNLKCRIGNLENYLTRLLESGLVPFIKSSPGAGKSAVVHQVAEKLKLKLIDHRMSTSAPEDLTGLPEFYDLNETERRARFVPLGDLFPLEGDKIPEGYDGWLLFLDEFNSADRRTMAASYKLILDKMVGQKRLHSNVAIVLAGNLMTDKAIVSPVGTALQSRVAHLELEINVEDWIEWAWDHGIDHRIISYISQFGVTKLMDFNPDHKDHTFCCPRTWGFMSNLIKDRKIDAAEIANNQSLYAGVISSGVALEFLNYTQIFDELPAIERIIQDPDGVEMPKTTSHKYAIITMMIANMSVANFPNFLKYAKRMEKSLEVLMVRSSLKRAPEVSRLHEYNDACIALAQMLKK